MTEKRKGSRVRNKNQDSGLKQGEGVSQTDFPLCIMFLGLGGKAHIFCSLKS